MSGRLAGKTAIVTGAASGIGFATAALSFAKRFLTALLHAARALPVFFAHFFKPAFFFAIARHSRASARLLPDP